MRSATSDKDGVLQRHDLIHSLTSTSSGSGYPSWFPVALWCPAFTASSRAHTVVPGHRSSFFPAFFGSVRITPSRFPLSYFRCVLSSLYKDIEHLSYALRHCIHDYYGYFFVFWLGIDVGAELGPLTALALSTVTRHKCVTATIIAIVLVQLRPMRHHFWNVTGPLY